MVAGGWWVVSDHKYWQNIKSGNVLLVQHKSFMTTVVVMQVPDHHHQIMASGRGNDGDYIKFTCIWSTSVCHRFWSHSGGTLVLAVDLEEENGNAGMVVTTGYQRLTSGHSSLWRLVLVQKNCWMVIEFYNKVWWMVEGGWFTKSGGGVIFSSTITKGGTSH